MLALLYAGLAIVGIGYFLFVLPFATPVERERNAAEAVAAALVAYHQAMIDWCRSSAGCSDGGPVAPATELVLPPSYTARPWLYSTVYSGIVVTWAQNAPTGNLATSGALIAQTNGATAAGRTAWADSSHSSIVVANSGTRPGIVSVVSVPAAVMTVAPASAPPIGAPALMLKVR